MRIAFGRIAQESNALSPVVTTMEDFERTHYLQGAKLLAACQPDGFEAKGFLRDAELSGFVQGARKHARKIGVEGHRVIRPPEPARERARVRLIQESC